MAILHDATITPGKRELMKGFLPTRTWFEGDLGLRPHASFRFDDPEGEVGVECFLFGAEGGPDQESPTPTYVIAMTYRGAPLEGAEEHLIGTTDHSVLGPRWVYDAMGDPVGVSTFLTAILTGGHQAELTMEEDGRVVTFDPTCTVSGSGTAQGEAGVVPAGPVSVLDPGNPSISRLGDHELVLARVVGTPLQGDLTLTAQWADQPPVVLAVARPVS